MIEFDPNRHYMGEPCKRGHLGIRSMTNSGCVECARIASAAHHAKNRAEINARKSQYGKENRERITVQKRKWREQNRNKVEAIESRAKDTRKQWRKENRGKLNASAAKRNAAKLQATPKWADLKALEQIYANCPDGYEVDHIVPLVSDLVCGLHYEQNLQYLTETENRTKGNRYWPDMPC